MLKETEITKLKKWSNKFFENAEKDSYTFDFESEIDKTLTYEENKNQLRGKIRTILNNYNQKAVESMKKKDIEIPKKQVEELLTNQIRKIEIQAELEFEKTLTKIENDKTTNTIEDFYFIPKQFAKMVAYRNAKGLILIGEAGIGKSYCVMRAFREADKKFVYLSGHITSLELYQFLYEHKEDNIVLDDVNVFNNEINLNMLKSALNDNLRQVCYNTTSSKLRVPNKFIFNGTITILLNDKPKNNDNLKAVESRVLNYELNMSYADKIKIIFELAKQDYKDLTLEQRQDIAKWIRENSNQGTKNLNLRTLFLFYEMFIFDNANWKILASKILIQNEDITLIIQGTSIPEWCSKTGKSRATYYNYLKQVK